jgi:hypothetical protein
MIEVDSNNACSTEMTILTNATQPIRGFANVPSVHRSVAVLSTSWSQRRDRPWLALIAVPLAMNASGLVHLWWLWVPLLVGAAASTPAWQWSFVLSFQLAVLGTEWAYVGATALAQWPTQRQFVGLTWAGVALYTGGVANLHREIRSFREWRRRCRSDEDEGEGC